MPGFLPIIACAWSSTTWSKIGSFVLGYFLGSFMMDWIHQRASRGIFGTTRQAAVVTAGSTGSGGERIRTS